MYYHYDSLSFVQRLSSSQRRQMYYHYGKGATICPLFRGCEVRGSRYNILCLLTSADERMVEEVNGCLPIFSFGSEHESHQVNDVSVQLLPSSLNLGDEVPFHLLVTIVPNLRRDNKIQIIYCPIHTFHMPPYLRRRYHLFKPLFKPHMPLFKATHASISTTCLCPMVSPST